MNRAITIVFAATLLIIWSALSTPPVARGETPLTVAVAANALVPVKELARAFTDAGGGEVRVVSGSTGKLYAQIVQGAPFDVFLAADRERPARLFKKGLTDGEPFTYAQGTLVLWTPKAADLNGAGMDVLKEKRFNRIAIANPRTAPYGRAAMEALESAGLVAAVGSKLVYGESVSQAFGFARSGNADAAIVALSTVTGTGGAYAVILAGDHSPILQDGVVLKDAPKAARDFITFMKGPGRAVFAKYGYK